MPTAMNRFSVRSAEREGEHFRQLRDDQTGAFATIWPAFGNNCIEASLPAPDGQLIPVLLAPEHVDQVRERPSWWGIPLLFPWPGRIPGGAYAFEGQTYHLPVLDAEGNAIHGFVKDRAWREVATSETDAAASITCSIDSEAYPETLAGFPFPYRLTTTYRLDEEGLSLRIDVENTGGGRLPFACGVHPYFRIPVAERGTRAACLVYVPASRRWNLAKLAKLPTEVTLNLDDVSDPVVPEDDLRHPRALGDDDVDGGRTGIALEDGRVECFVSDPAAGITLVMQAAAPFQTLVIWSPPGRPGLCLEPWTAPPNVFNLAARGLRESGLIVLQPGERWDAWMRLRVRGSTPW